MLFFSVHKFTYSWPKTKIWMRELLLPFLLQNDFNFSTVFFSFIMNGVDFFFVFAWMNIWVTLDTGCEKRYFLIFFNLMQLTVKNFQRWGYLIFIWACSKKSFWWMFNEQCTFFRSFKNIERRGLWVSEVNFHFWMIFKSFMSDFEKLSVEMRECG